VSAEFLLFLIGAIVAGVAAWYTKSLLAVAIGLGLAGAAVMVYHP
jgi:branched-subunit amino acid transport protein